MMMEYEMSQAEGNAKGLLKWYNRQMKKQAGISALTGFQILLPSVNASSECSLVAALSPCLADTQLVLFRPGGCWPSEMAPMMWQ